MFKAQNMSWHSNSKALINREYQLIEKALITQDIENNKILQKKKLVKKKILYTRKIQNFSNSIKIRSAQKEKKKRKEKEENI